MYINQYDIYLALLGGVIIGISTSVHLLLKVRVTSFTGILFGIVSLERTHLSWRIALVLSIMSISAIMF